MENTEREEQPGRWVIEDPEELLNAYRIINAVHPVFLDAQRLLEKQLEGETGMLNDGRALLNGAMFMLEVYGDGKWENGDLVASAHSMIQRALAIFGGADEYPDLHPSAMEILAESQMEIAILDAKDAASRSAPL